MLFKICQSCKKPFKAGNSLHIKFCSAECLDNAYVNGRLDQETIDHAARLLQEDIASNSPREREINTQTLRELYFLEILKMNRLVSREEYKKDILNDA